MDLRVSPITAVLGPHAVMAHAEMANAIAAANMATTSALANPAPAAITASAGIIAGLQSSLTQAGLMAADAGHTDSTSAPRPDLALAGPGSHTPSATEAPAAPPLTPAWITALQTPALRQGPWPQAPGGHAARRDAGVARQDGADADADTGPKGEGEGEGEGESEYAAQAPAGQAARQGHGETASGDETETPGLPGWPAGLPEEVQTELARGRSVLLAAPPGPGQRGLQLALLGVGARGQRQSLRMVAQGAPAATANAIDWLCWRVRREGEDGQRAVLAARHTALRSSRLHGLVLRATATREPPPLRPADHAWLDILEPQRLWRALGSQWTLLLAWSPRALPGGER